MGGELGHSCPCPKAPLLLGKQQTGPEVAASKKGNTVVFLGPLAVHLPTSQPCSPQLGQGRNLLETRTHCPRSQLGCLPSSLGRVPRAAVHPSSHASVAPGAICSLDAPHPLLQFVNVAFHRDGGPQRAHGVLRLAGLSRPASPWPAQPRVHLLRLLAEALAHDHVHQRVEAAVAVSHKGRDLCEDVDHVLVPAAREDVEAQQRVQEGADLEGQPADHEQQQDGQDQQRGLPLRLDLLELLHLVVTQHLHDLHGAEGDDAQGQQEAHRVQEDVGEDLPALGWVDDDAGSDVVALGVVLLHGAEGQHG